MTSKDPLSSDTSLKLHQGVNASFASLKVDPSFLPAYQHYMMGQIKQYLVLEGIDFYEGRDSLVEPDDPESETHATYLEFAAKEFIGHYVASLDEGHIPQFAEVYATEILSDGYEPRFSASAYEAIGGKNSPWSIENPAYQDVLHACRYKGKDDDFAHRCAGMLPNYDFNFKSAFEATAKYEKNISRTL